MGPTAAAAETLGYRAARERVLAAAAPLDPEVVPLSRARGRALAESVSAPHPLPPFPNSSMDGVAVRSADLARASVSAPVELAVRGEVRAGTSFAETLAPGTCVWIMTGAMLPAGADAVVAVEDLETSGRGAGERVTVRAPAPPGQNIREAGADLQAGRVALAAGRELSPHDLALLAALGAGRIRVGARARVIAFSTGDELLDPDAPLRPGTIRDSNLPMLSALLEEAGAETLAAERLPDDPAVVAREIQRALERADVVITMGGVSAGRHDPVKLGIAEIPGIARWRVAMKPGRPQAFGAPGGRLFFGLPGNPASVACVFEALVRPALRRLQGHETLDRPRLTVRTAEAIASREGRTDFVRVVLETSEGGWRAREAGVQVSGHLTPQSRAHALLIVPEERPRLEPGERAEALLLRWP